jgi:hypothetical protein
LGFWYNHTPPLHPFIKPYFVALEVLSYQA